jgi:hypothetical protein
MDPLAKSEVGLDKTATADAVPRRVWLPLPDSVIQIGR